MVIDRNAYAAALELLYDARMTVYTVDNVRPLGLAPAVSGRRADTSAPLYIDVPCYVEFENAETVAGVMPATGQRITLICANDLDILQGSTIDVVKHGKTYRFRASGLPDKLGSHQEIALESQELAVV